MVQKAVVRLHSVTLPSNEGFTWKVTTGVQPYTAVMHCKVEDWDQTLSKVMGIPLTMEITDARGVRVKVERVSILHRVPSSSPNRASFVVADRRWRWIYRLFCRDYNTTRTTGDRDFKGQRLPLETQVTVDEYDYLPASLDGTTRIWTPARAVEDMLTFLVGEDDWEIKSFPIEVNGEEGQITLQNVTLRDSGEQALQRLLAYIPGAQVYVRLDGKVVVFDGTDLEAAEEHLQTLPPSQWGGDAETMVDRKRIRPKRVDIYYQREVEAVFDFRDDYSGQTAAQPIQNDLYIENVLPTVDPETRISEYNPESDTVISTVVPAGTWVPVGTWLAAMDRERRLGNLISEPWTFDTIRTHWVNGSLDGVLGANGSPNDVEGNVAMRVEALKENFRRTFRVSKRYMNRVRSLKAVRVALLHPVTGTPAPAAVWGQACFIPNDKGKHMSSRRDWSKSGFNRNVNYLAPFLNGEKALVDTPPGPAKVEILNEDAGIFRVNWVASPYGTDKAIIPCLVAGDDGQPNVPTRDMSQQDDAPMGHGFVTEQGTNGLFLADKMELKVMMTMVPAAPNNKNQFHRLRIEPEDLRPDLRSEFRIQDGEGPPMEFFVPPGELTARFAWANEQLARETIRDLLGLTSDDPSTAGIEPGTPLEGFQIVNEDRHLTGHAKALALELLAPFADNLQGQVLTIMQDDLELAGNMTGATMRFGTSSKIDVAHEFPAQRPPLPRFAFFSSAERQIVLGKLPY